MQDMTDAETSVRGYTLRAVTRTRSLPYIVAMNYLPGGQASASRALAAPYPALAEAVQEQEDATSTLDHRVRPADRRRQEPRRRPMREARRGCAAPSRTCGRTNSQVDLQISEVTDQISARSRAVVFWTLAAVVLLPLLMIMVGSIAARRMGGEALVEPLDDILGGATQRLREGDLSARAAEEGPEEIREIAVALNRLDRGEPARPRRRGRPWSPSSARSTGCAPSSISTVSHELRTPLTSIMGYLELLEDQLADQLDATQTAMLAVVRRNLDAAAAS